MSIKMCKKFAHNKLCSKSDIKRLQVIRQNKGGACGVRRRNMRESRGGGGQGVQPPPPLKLTKIGFISNTGPDLLQNQKATKPSFNVGLSLAPMMFCF